MKNYFVILLVVFSSILSAQQIHCGYDFTSYIVVQPHEVGKKDHIEGLKVTLIDFFGRDLVNTDSKYSWTHQNQVLEFYHNYKIDKSGKKITKEHPEYENSKWHFYFTNEAYLVSVNNEFPAEQFRIKIEDPEGRYKTQIVQLYSFNMYILCTGEAKSAARFGRRVNQPIKVTLEPR